MSLDRVAGSDQPGLAARMWRGLRLWAAAWRIADPTMPNALTHKAVVLDICERLFVVGVFLTFVHRMLWHYSDGLPVITGLAVIGETLPFLYIVLRVPSNTLSQRPTDWLFGLLGTVMPLLVKPETDVAALIPALACFAIMVAGILLQLMAKVVLGRAFGIVAANRGVRVLGPYRFVRHPMYAGYTLTHIGFLLAMPSLQNILFYAMAFTFQIARIFREERVLRQDDRYHAFAARVRYRLIPGFF
jgi:protein-S-isoprenylcysteine O-methyltransferase Ste14